MYSTLQLYADSPRAQSWIFFALVAQVYTLMACDQFNGELRVV